MTVFVLSVAFVLVISALCSVTESALYSVRLPYVRKLAESGAVAGSVLLRFKSNMEQPIAAILILNTAANTAGAAVAGAQARILFGERAVVWFSIAFTLAVLLFSEIIPKTVGVVYNRLVAKTAALPLQAVMLALRPLIVLVRHLTRALRPRGKVLTAPEEEVRQLAKMSAEEGSILPYEAELVDNVLALDRVKARDIMTPRPVVFKLPDALSVRDAAATIGEQPFSRIPIYSEDDPESWTGYLLTRRILSKLQTDPEASLRQLAQPLFFVSEKTPGHVLLRSFLKRRTHLFGVSDDFGSIVGIVTLEDVMEALIGREIVDEVDEAVDMQDVARLRMKKRLEPPAAQDGPE